MIGGRGAWPMRQRVTWENRDAIEIAEYDDLCAPHLAH
jgi:hypothetical protein